MKKKTVRVAINETGETLKLEMLSGRDRLYFHWALDQPPFTRSVVCNLLWDKYGDKTPDKAEKGAMQ